MSDRGDSENCEALVRRFGGNIHRLRLARGLSQTELAELAAMHRNDVSLIELGRRRPLSDVLMKLAGALGVEPEALLEGIGWADGDEGAGVFIVLPGRRLPKSIIQLANQPRQGEDQDGQQEHQQASR
jgi:transcriptional regulator with XRE-family HTH domain